MSKRLDFVQWAVLLAYFFLGTLYNIVTPLFEKPDENWHFAAAMYILENGRLPRNDAPVPDHYAYQEANQPPLYYLTTALLWRGMGFQTLTPGYLQLAQRNAQYRPDQALQTSDNRRLFIHGRCEGPCDKADRAVYIGRTLSLFYVGLSLRFTYRAVRRIFPDQIGLPLLTTAFIAFNPQVLHIASSVSNDGLTILLMSIGLYLAARWLTGAQNRRIVLLMAFTAGAALLTKLSAGALGLLLGLLLLFTSRQPRRDMVLYGAVALGVCGWWFAFNTLVYHDPTALNAHIAAAPQSPPPQGGPDLLFQVRTVIVSYWAEFGWGQIVLPKHLTDWILAIACISLSAGLLYFGRRWRKMPIPQRQFLLLGVGLIAVILVLLLRWMTTTQAPHGRLLFPALLPISLLMAVGWLGFIGRRWRLPAGLFISVILAANTLYLALTFIQPAYAIPPPIIAPQTGETQITFTVPDGEASIASGTVTVHEIALAQTPDRLTVQIAWQMTTEFSDDYLVFVHVLNAAGEIIAQRDSYPGLSNKPFTRMQTGEYFADVYPMYPPAEPVAAVRIGLYRLGNTPNTWERLEAISDRYVVRDNAVTVPVESLRVIDAVDTRF